MDLIGVNDIPQWWGVLRIVAPNDAAVGRRLGRCGLLCLRMRAIVMSNLFLLINQCGLDRRNVWTSLFFCQVVPEVLVSFLLFQAAQNSMFLGGP